MDNQFTNTAGITEFLSRDDVQAFLRKVANEHQLDYKNLLHYFKNLTPDAEVINALNYSFESYAPWYLYYQQYITEKRIMSGLRFWQKYYSALQRAEQEYQVPANIILGILGLETCYGEHLDNYNILRSLATLAFNYPRRSHYFQQELIAFLLMLEKFNLTPTLTGTYTGALGLCNSMPSNYVTYALSSQSIQNVNLYDPVEAIFYVAHFFRKFGDGWRNDSPIAIPAELDHASDIKSLKIDHTYTLAEFKKLKIFPKINLSLPLEMEANLLPLTSGPDGEKGYWFVFYNYHQIYGYNPSSIYCMAVYHLGQCLTDLFYQL